MQDPQDENVAFTAKVKRPEDETVNHITKMAHAQHDVSMTEDEIFKKETPKPKPRTRPISSILISDGTKFLGGTTKMVSDLHFWITYSHIN